MFVPGMAFNGQSLNAHSLGGSETAGLQMAFALARQKHMPNLKLGEILVGEDLVSEGHLMKPSKNKRRNEKAHSVKFSLIEA